MADRSSVIRSKATIKEAIIGPDGTKRWYDSGGNPTSAPKEKKDGQGIPYDEDVAETFVRYMSEGEKFSVCLEKVGLDHTTYLMWRKNSAHFAAAIDTARAMRSELLHDSSFEKDIRPMVLSKSVFDMDEEEREQYSQTLKAVANKRKIIKEFQGVDAPGRFGHKFDPNTAAAAVAISIEAVIPDRLKEIVNAGFRPALANSGELEVQGVQVNDDQTISEVDGEKRADGEDTGGKAGKGV